MTALAHMKTPRGIFCGDAPVGQPYGVAEVIVANGQRVLFAHPRVLAHLAATNRALTVKKDFCFFFHAHEIGVKIAKDTL